MITKLKAPTSGELHQLVEAAHRACRCDGGNTMGCRACWAERKLNALIAAGLIKRLPADKPFTNPHYFVVGKTKPVAKPRWIMHERHAHLADLPCAECGTIPKVPMPTKTDRDVLLEIGSIIGGPACNYNSAVEVAEWRRRAACISDLVQEQLKGGK